MVKYNEIKLAELKKALKEMEIPFSVEDKKPELWKKYKAGLNITTGITKPKKRKIIGKKYRLRLKRYTLNSGNIIITNDGRNNTHKINKALAERIIAKGDVHLLDIIPIYA